MSINAINAFKSYITGIQRPTLFDVTLNFQSNILANNFFTLAGNQDAIDTETDSNTGTGDTINLAMNFMFTCKATDFPEDTIGTIEVPYMGRKVKFFGDRQYSDWNTTLLVDNDWAVYKALYNWHVAMNGPRNIVGASRNMNDYKANAYITCYGNDGQANITAYLVGMFPSSVQTISLDWDTTDSAMEVQVTWAYDYSILGREDIAKNKPDPYYKAKINKSGKSQTSLSRSDENTRANPVGNATWEGNS